MPSPIRTFSQLLKKAENCNPQKVAVVCAEDNVALSAVAAAVEHGFAQAVLIGFEKIIRDRITKLQLDDILTDAEIYDAYEIEEALTIALQLKAEKKIDILMKGRLRTDQLLKGVLRQENDVHRGAFLSDTLLYEDNTSGETRLIGITDGGLNPAPDLYQKIEIIHNTIPIFHALGIEKPKIGIMSATEVVTPAVPSTVDAKEISKKAHKTFPKAEVFGPLALDNALLKSAADAKAIDSPVAGAVDCMVMPNIEAGNLLAKAVKYLYGSACAHVVMGATIPVLIPSRVESAEDKLYAIALGSVVAEFGG